MVNLIAIDDGSSAIKWVTKDNSDMFNSIVEPSLCYTAGGDRPAPYSYRIHSAEYSVTDNARDAIDTTGRQYQTSKVNRVLVHEAIRRAGLTGDVAVAVTLPVSMCIGPQSQQNKDEKRDNLKRPIYAADGRELANIVDVYVYPEGYCGALHALGNGADGDILAIDIGGYTTDITQVSASGDLAAFTSIDNGTIQHAQELAKEIQRVNGGSTPAPLNLAMGVLTGRLSRPEHDYSQTVKSMITELAANAFRHAREITDPAYVSKYVFLGGGARLLPGVISDSDGKTMIPEEPELANVKAVFAMASDKVAIQ